MTAFVAESPATYDQLPLSSCSPLYLAYFLRQILMVFSPDTWLSPFLPPFFSGFLLFCHLYSFFFPSCYHFNFLSSYFVWSVFPFLSQRRLRMTPGNMEWVRNLCAVSGLVILPGSPSTTATGLLTVFIIDSAVSFSGSNLSLLQNSFFFLIFSLCLRKFLLSFPHYKRTADRFCVSILKTAYPSFIKP